MINIIKNLKENLSLLNIMKNEEINCKRYELELQHRVSRLMKEVLDFLLKNDTSEVIQINTNQEEFSFDKLTLSSWNLINEMESFIKNSTDGILNEQLQKLVIKYSALTGILLIIKSYNLKSKINED